MNEYVDGDSVLLYLKLRRMTLLLQPLEFRARCSRHAYLTVRLAMLECNALGADSSNEWSIKYA